MIKKYSSIYYLLFFALLFSSCDNGQKNRVTKTPVVRFDQLLIQLDTNNIREAYQHLSQAHPRFVDIYFSEVLPIPGYEEQNDTFFDQLNGFIKDEKILALYDLIQEEYRDMDDILLDMGIAFSEAKKWFPDMDAPRIYTFLSEFAYQRFIFEDEGKDGLAIGLDLFLGDRFDYSLLESGTNTFSNYLTRTYDKEHLLKKTMEAWLDDKLGNVKGDRLVDHMIHNGTKLHLLNHILNVEDTIITEYKKEQSEWVLTNVEEMWAFYIENNWFYTTEDYVIKRLTFPAPNATALGLPEAAPGQTANYLGWKIVESYLRRYPETTIDDLLKQDAQKTLELSKFKPKNK